MLDYAGYPGEPADKTAHIDMFVKLLSNDTVLIATSKDEPFKSNGEKAIQYFKSIRAPGGKPYKIFTLDGWVVTSWELTGVPKDIWYTYTNSLIVNNVVIVPSFDGKAEYERIVKKTYEDAMPGVQVMFVPSEKSIKNAGSVHCLTQTIPRV